MSQMQHILLAQDGGETELEAILQDLDCTLLKAGSADEALDALLKHDVTLVVLDLQRPDADGAEVVELMRRSPRTRMVPALFVAASSRQLRYLPAGYDVGTVDYLFRPLAPEVIRSKANFFLDLDMQKRRLEAKRRQSQASREAFLRAMGNDGPPAK